MNLFTFLFFLGLGNSRTTNGKVLESSKLKQLNEEIRNGDNRLIRPYPTYETFGAQNEICPYILKDLIDTVNSTTASSIKIRGDAAEILQLCTTNHPTNRADIGSINNGQIFDSIQNLIHTGMTIKNSTRSSTWHISEKKEEEHQRIYTEVLKAIAQASELIWILTYNNEQNQKGFYNVGIVDELVGVIQNCPINFGHNNPCSETVMWSLAALQNMAASYCDSEDGYCDWERDDDSLELYLTDDVMKVTTVDGNVREQIYKYIKEDQFGGLLHHLICGGPVHSPHDETYSWPSLAKDIHSESHPEIVPWAAAGLLKSLAIDSIIRMYWTENKSPENAKLFMCLCDMYNNSPDWLEEDKSYTALYRLSWDESCPDIHDRCDDKEGWVEAKTGKTCFDYEDEKLCATMGERLGKDVGFSANDACCVCGGGTPKSLEGLKGSKEDEAVEASFQKLQEL